MAWPKGHAINDERELMSDNSQVEIIAIDINSLEDPGFIKFDLSGKTTCNRDVGF